MRRAVLALALLFALTSVQTRADGATAVADPESKQLPQFRDGPPIRIAPTPIAPTPQGKSRDLRPFYVLGGLCLLGALFMWNRKNRAVLEAADRDQEPKP